jgi:hypothetical protein
VLARYLARTNIQAQQTDVPADPDARDNLFEPRDATVDRGSHGPFDEQAHDTSPTQVLSRNRGKIAVGAAVLAAAVAAATAARDQQGSVT